MKVKIMKNDKCTFCNQQATSYHVVGIIIVAYTCDICSEAYKAGYANGQVALERKIQKEAESKVKNAENQTNEQTGS